MEIQEITLIGTGRLSRFFVQTLSQKGMRVGQIYGRDAAAAKSLASLCQAEAVSDFHAIKPGASLYLILISDHAVSEVASRLNLTHELVVHTAGALSLDVLQGVSQNTGVCWPLQSFSYDQYPDPKDIPFFVEATNEKSAQAIKQFAHKISPDVFEVTYEQRAYLHLAAVIVNNFPNHLYSKAEQILKAKEMHFKVLIPIIQQTAKRLGDSQVHLMQTGPARRGDEEVMNKHRELLKEFPDMLALYNTLSLSIQQHYPNSSSHYDIL